LASVNVCRISNVYRHDVIGDEDVADARQFSG
jgi:hypothetical protein